MKKYLILALLAFASSNASAASLFSDNFNTYADGSLITVSGGIWANHSGTVGQVDVQSRAVNLTATESEDVNALISGGSYTSGLLYYSLTVNFSVLPAVGGGYFAHFKDATTSGFRARLYATTTGAAPGFYRLGINNGSNLPITATYPSDLSLGSFYQVVVRYDASSPANASTLWVDPTLETDPSVTATDGVTILPITSFALRQSTIAAGGMGTLTADNVLVATTFAEVVPEPSSILLASLGGLLGLFRLRRKH
jgi:hypothetical protein